MTTAHQGGIGLPESYLTWLVGGVPGQVAGNLGFFIVVDRAGGEGLAFEGTVGRGHASFWASVDDGRTVGEGRRGEAPAATAALSTEATVWALRLAAASRALSFRLPMLGIAIAAMMPMMAMTTSISTRLKPALREVLSLMFFIVCLCVFGCWCYFEVSRFLGSSVSNYDIYIRFQNLIQHVFYIFHNFLTIHHLHCDNRMFP
jgi:hypothetical protein